MQQNISPDTPSSAASKESTAASSSASVKYSQETYADVMALLNIQAQAAQLAKATDVAKTLQQKQLEQPKMAGAPKLSAPPKTPTMKSLKQTTQTVATAAAEKTPEQQTNATKVADLLNQLIQAKSDDEVVSILTQLTTLMEGTEPPLDLSTADQTTILNAFTSLSGGSEYLVPLTDKLLNYLLTNMVSSGATKDEIMAKLKDLANAQPPTLLTSAAKQMYQMLNSNPDLLNSYYTSLQDPDAQQNALAAIKTESSGMFTSDAMVQSDFLAIINAFIAANTTDNKNTMPMMTLEATKQTGNSATTKLLQTEMTFLSMMLAILEKYAPNNPQVQKYAQQLKAIMGEDPSNLTPDQINQLNDMTTNIGSLEASLAQQGIIPKDANVQFLQQLYTMFKQLVDQTNGEIKQYKTLLAQLQTKLDQYTNLGNDYSTIQQILAEIMANKNNPGWSLSGDDANKLMSAFADMMQQYPNLDPEDQALVDKLLDQLGQVSWTGTSETVGSDSVLAPMFVRLLMDQYPTATPQQLLQKMQDLYGGGASSNTVIASLLNKMEGIVNTPGFPNNQPYPWAGAFGDSKYTLSISDFWNAMASGMIQGTAKENSGLTENMITQAGDDATYVTGIVTQITSQANGVQNTIDQLDTLDNGFQTGEASAHNKYYANSSIANQFYDAILNHFMPGQDAFLAQIAAYLFFYNFASLAFSTLEGDMAGFDTSASNYTTGTTMRGQLQPDNSTYKGSEGAEKNQLDGEKTQAENDKAKVEAAQGDIRKSQSDLNQKQADLKTQLDNGDITQAQYDDMSSQYTDLAKSLKQDYGSLDQAGKNLDKLIKDLTALSDNITKVTLPDGSEGYAFYGTKNSYHPSLDTLTADEGYVVNGNPDVPGPDPKNFPNWGGLAGTYTNVSKNQSKYSSLSTEQQTKLSETMTEVQQEWSIVSSAMQTLNEVYLTFAQNISSG